AFHDYHDTFRSFSPGVTFDKQGRMLHGWLTRLLPYIEEAQIYRQINMNTPWNTPENIPAFREEIRIYINPGIEYTTNQDGLALSHYAGNIRILGSDVAWKMQDITDGLSNTILAGEVAGNFKPWGPPANSRDPALGINQGSNGFGGPWRRYGAVFLFADGHV